MNAHPSQINSIDRNLSLKQKFVENYSGFRLYQDEFQDQTSDLMLISNLIETINSSEDVCQIETKLQENIQNIIAIDFCSLMFWEESKQKLLPVSPDSEKKSQSIVARLIEEGIADWIISEKDVAIVPDLETLQNEIKKFFIIVPLIQSKIDFGLLVLRTSYGRSDILPKKISLITILANLAFSAIANTHLYRKVEVMDEERDVLMNEISELSKIAVIGEISDNFFHTMKNRIQVMISSLELLNKNVKTEEVMKILKEEVNRTAKALKNVS
ncbi:MAG: GAF domain-containing protein, partial [Bacteroidetes bacterium]|nr:GAF domain-containing protein [Bacteroidota bacterium]